jgi:hypothetical protein
MMPTRLQDIEQSVLQECEDDYVGLWSIFWRITAGFPEADESLTRALAVAIVFDLLSSNLVVAGFPTPDGRGFEAWTLSPAETARLVKREVTFLDRSPTIGEVLWLTTKDSD